MTFNCSSCGSKLDDTSGSCPSCGAEIRKNGGDKVKFNEDNKYSSRQIIINSKLGEYHIMFGLLGAGISLITIISGKFGKGIPLVAQITTLPWGIPIWFTFTILISTGLMAFYFKENKHS